MQSDPSPFHTGKVAGSIPAGTTHRFRSSEIWCGAIDGEIGGPEPASLINQQRGGSCPLRLQSAAIHLSILVEHVHGRAAGQGHDRHHWVDPEQQGIPLASASQTPVVSCSSPSGFPTDVCGSLPSFALHIWWALNTGVPPGPIGIWFTLSMKASRSSPRFQGGKGWPARKICCAPAGRGSSLASVGRCMSPRASSARSRWPVCRGPSCNVRWQWRGSLAAGPK